MRPSTDDNCARRVAVAGAERGSHGAASTVEGDVGAFGPEFDPVPAAAHAAGIAAVAVVVAREADPVAGEGVTDTNVAGGAGVDVAEVYGSGRWSHERIGPVVDLVSIADPIPIGVRVVRIGAVDGRLVVVGEAVGIVIDIRGRLGGSRGGSVAGQDPAEQPAG